MTSKLPFKITANWLDRSVKQSDDELEATLAAFRLHINQINVTEYVTLLEDGRQTTAEPVIDKLHIPVYFIAEWIADNWWPLFYEPRKTDDEKRVSPSYDLRHSLVSAQHGFALPSLRVEPAGTSLQISCGRHDVPLAGVSFKNGADTLLQTKSAQAIFKAFVESCVDRLISCGITGTPLQRAWDLVVQTTDEEAIFCVLAGALGINPYGATAEISSALDRLADVLGITAAQDICMASSDVDVLASELATARLAAKLDGPHDINFAPLKDVRVPEDRSQQPAWLIGKSAAKSVRQQLDISLSDSQGADKFLEKLNVDTDSDHNSNTALDELVFTGAVDRRNDNASIVLVQSQDEVRRFAACRAVFLGINNGHSQRRIVTNAVTRDQQASRAFAAELLTPADHVKSRARGRRLGFEEIMNIARERRVGIEVVRLQAINHGLVVGY